MFPNHPQSGVFPVQPVTTLLEIAQPPIAFLVPLQVSTHGKYAGGTLSAWDSIGVVQPKWETLIGIIIVLLKLGSLGLRVLLFIVNFV